MSAPKVLHFIETDIPGGAESMLLDLCRQQRRLGLDPVVGHFDHPYFTERCRELGIESFPLPARGKFKRAVTLPSFALELARRMRREDVRLLHSHLFGPIVGGSVSAFLARIPHVGTLHDIHMVQEVPARISQLQLGTLLGTRLAAVSRQMLAFYRQRMKWRKDHISCIYNGIEAPETSRPLTREELSIPGGDAIAVLVGRLVPLKRVQDALHAAKEVMARCPLTVLVAGAGPELPELQALAGQLGIRDKVRFLGERRDIPALLAGADLFLQCSETEGLSMSIIEALHAGLPCIVSDVGGNAELVTHEYNGALYEVGDTAALSSWIERLALHEDIRRTMGKRSREAARLGFTAQACAGKYFDLYLRSGLDIPPQ